MNRVLIIGGAGFIGSHLAEGLCKARYSVRIIDNLSSGNINNLSKIIDSIDFIEGDIRDQKILMNSMEGIDSVFHLAAIPSVSKSVANPMVTNDVNVNGTLNILNIAKEQGIRRVIFSSSCAIYGENDNFPLREGFLPDPSSPYAVSKLTGEYYCKVFYNLYGLETVSLRYFNVFGPRQDPTSEYSAVIPKFITAILNNKNPIIFGDGKQTRDFIYVENVVRANILAMKSNKGIGDVFNIASQRESDLLTVIKKLEKISKKSLNPKFQPQRTGDIKYSYGDISRSKNIIGYIPTIDIESGLEKTFAYFKSKIV